MVLFLFLLSIIGGLFFYFSMCSSLPFLSVSSSFYHCDTGSCWFKSRTRSRWFERIKADDETSFDIDSYAHYLHHKYFECNYADGILPLDRWFGTLYDGSEESFIKMRARLSKNKRD